MKVLYIHQYFKVPEQGGSLRSFYLARELVKAGHSVTMITTHDAKHRIRKQVEEINVIYLPVKYSNDMTFNRRSLAFLKFMIMAMFESSRHNRIDFCYVMTTPISTGIIALWNKFFLGRPYIFEVGDLWPKVPIEMGLLKARWKKRLLTSLERLFYINAKGLIGLSEPITHHLRANAPKVPCETVFNVSDCEGYNPSTKDIELEQKYKLKDQFVISYTGTFGLANNLSQVIEMAKAVDGLPIKFLLIGDGAERKKIIELTKQNETQNIHFFDYMKKSELQEIINVTDAMLVSFASYSSLHTGSPNKFFDALAAGKLVITNFEGWIGELIEKEECGFCADSPETFSLKVKRFLEDPKLMKRFKKNARELAERRFDLKIQSEKQQEFIKRLFT